MRALSLLLAALISGSEAQTAFLKAIAEDVRRGRCSPHLGTLQILASSPGPPGARAGLLLGRCWLLLGEPDRALHAFSAAARPGPLAPYAWLGASEAALRLGDTRRAREELVRVLQATRGPATVRAHLALAEALTPPREAERHARAVIRSTKEDAFLARAWASLGRALAAQGRRKEAAEAFGWAAWAFPGNPVEEEARQALRSLAGGRAPVPPLVRLSRARRLADPQAAEQEIVRALQAGLPPEAEAEAWLQLGIFRLRTHGAAEAFRRAARFPPLAPRALYWLGIALGGREADRVWRGLVHQYPTSPWAARAFLALGLRAEARGDLEKAIELFTRLAHLHPSAPSADEARWRMGWLRYRQGRFEEAERIFLRSAARDPGTGRAPAHLYWAAKSRARRGMDPGPLLLRVARAYPHTYYGMRARERLGLTDPPRPAPGVPFALPGESFLPVYEELLALGFFEESEEEAEAALAHGPSRRVLRTLAKARLQLGDFPGAVLAAEAAVRRGGADGDLWRLAYPRPYWDAVREAARGTGLDPLLVLAVVREESRFDPQAISPAGAVGLMQLLPATARELEPALGFRDLLNPETNLRLGTRYLKAQLRAFGDLRLALAAYNAGPSAARRFASEGTGDPDEFIERIPYGETRTYLRRVLESYRIYRWLYP